MTDEQARKIIFFFVSNIRHCEYLLSSNAVMDGDEVSSLKVKRAAYQDAIKTVISVTGIEND